ncbi:MULTISPECIES: MFS transporter [unclassified Paenibacillus]|uniref:MFS transporter n=1 Tax=unclassified Paenibacillus TaxID=185978 RepID=UPI002F40CE34
MNINLRYFLLYYIFIYAGHAIYSTFVPVYFNDIGFTPMQIGTILSFGPFIAMLAQPFWGAMSDRARSKNMILLLLIVGSAAAMLFVPLSTAFPYVVAVICIFTLFQTSIFAISDTITLEAIDKLRTGNFGHIRMGGTFGFAIMSLVFGFIAERQLGSMFPIYASIMALCFLLVLKFPHVAGHQTKGKGMSIGVILKNYKLMLYLGFNFILQITLGFYYSFFPIYFRELGGDNVLLGWSMVISSLAEVPFLLFADKIFKRVKIHYILIAAAIATTLRWILFYSIQSPLWALPVQLLHGAMFIVLTVTMAAYINREVPKELKASGQTFNGLLNLGVARIIGSLAGGIAITSFGLRNVFLYNAIIAVLSTLIFGLLVWRLQNRERKDKRLRHP